MVTRGMDDWEQHKKDVLERTSQWYGEERASKFHQHYVQRFDKFGRPLLHYKAAYSLYDDYIYTHKIGSRFIAIVGTGGVGKTTLMKNLAYFFDDTFDLQRLNMEMRPFINKIQELPRIKANRAVCLDEPDDTYHPQSKMGKLIRRVLGKCRQQNLFLMINATDLKDIPPFFYRKLNTIIFLPMKGTGYLFKDSPKKKIYLIQKIRKEYGERGYGIFFDLKKYALEFKTFNMSPFTKHEEEQYILDKQADYDRDINKAIKEMDNPTKDISKGDKNKFKIIHIYNSNPGITNAAIGRIMGIGGNYVGRVLREYRESGTTPHTNTSINSTKLDKNVRNGTKPEEDKDGNNNNTD